MPQIDKRDKRLRLAKWHGGNGSRLNRDEVATWRRELTAYANNGQGSVRIVPVTLFAVVGEGSDERPVSWEEALEDVLDCLETIDGFGSEAKEAPDAP